MNIKLVPSLLSILLLCFLVACKKEKIEGNYQILGNGKGSLETSSTNPNATSSITGTYNSSTKTMEYTITFSGLTGPPTGMHFHGSLIPRGNISAPVADITGFPASTSGTFQSTTKIAKTQENDLIEGKWYFQIHTNANRPGELRGPVIAIKE